MQGLHWCSIEPVAMLCTQHRALDVTKAPGLTLRWLSTPGSQQKVLPAEPGSVGQAEWDKHGSVGIKGREGKDCHLKLNIALNDS